MAFFQKIIRILLFFCLPIVLFGQKKNANYKYHIHKSVESIHIDGKADEAVWKSAQVAKDFFMVLPMDTSKTRAKTEVMMTYDDKNLYLIAINYNPIKGDYVVESLRRDFSFGKNDNFIVFMDTYGDQTNGFAFGANAMGAQWDGVMYEGAKVDLSWDNKWETEVTFDAEKWIIEMAIPFKTLRYKQNMTTWGINFSRLDIKTTEKSAWAPVPRQFPTASLAFAGELVWDAPPPHISRNISLIPYVLAGYSKNFDAKTDPNFRKEIGGDMKIALSSSLNLDLTVNPDFSQVEVDRQQTNLDRFELFFPERRQFFLENGDLLANFGTATVRPFFSRRIGLNAPIQFGARLSGKLDKNWRIGLMDMQTGKNGEGLPSQNFAILSLQRKVFARSSIGALMINKQTLDYAAVIDKKNISEYNRNIGLEYNLASANNQWLGKATYLKSFSPTQLDKNQAFIANIQKTTKRYTFGLSYENIGKNYIAEVGYVPRTNYQYLSPQASYLFFPKSSSKILSHGPTALFFGYFTPNLATTDNTAVVFYNINFRNLATFQLWTAKDFVRLNQPFDPTNYVGATLNTGTEHHWKSWGTEFVSKPQSLFSYAFGSRYGGYYANGKRLRLNGQLGYRVQPYLAVSMSAAYNRIMFEDDITLPTALKNNNFNFWLVGPRIDVTLTNKLYFTNFLQYNNQANNINLNIRLQWRYKPASDLFLVYTDNYLSDNFSVRNRALVFKFTYWWNL